MNPTLCASSAHCYFSIAYAAMNAIHAEHGFEVRFSIAYAAMNQPGAALQALKSFSIAYAAMNG